MQTYQTVGIHDYGEPVYLDGAQMQFTICAGPYPHGQTLAYCNDMEVARAIAHAFCDRFGEVVITHAD